MKRKSIFAGFFAGLLLAASVSCEKGTNETVNSEIGQESPVSKQIEGIPKDVTRLSEMDAVKVADMFLSSSDKLRTRSFSNKQVRSIVPVNGTDGEPAFYAVNYDDGFLWVSATKKLYPILAIVDHGSFDTAEDVGMGIDIVKDELVTASDSLAFEDIPESVRRAWREYEEKDAPVMPEIISTKAYSKDYLNALDKVYAYAAENGYDVYKLEDMVGPEGVTSNKVPEEILNGFYSLVEEDYTFGDEYERYKTSYVLVKEYSTREHAGPFTRTKWDQGRPYNLMFENPKTPLGCVTISTAQFMCYYESPDPYVLDGISYYWKDMPSNTINEGLPKVLADLKKRLNVSDKGSGKMKNAVSVLNSFGYDVEMRKYDVGLLLRALKSENIAILDGRKSMTSVGHQWICDGFDSWRCFGSYKLFALDNDTYPEFSFECISTSEKEDPTNSAFYLSMNWGWGGTSDGWFTEWTPQPNETEPKKNYTKDNHIVVKKQLYD